MWMLWHKLFGWDYALYTWGFDKHTAKLHNLGGVLFYKRLDGYCIIARATQVEWLTCKPEKYINES